MSNDILVPNIGDFNNVEIIEVLIKEGQEIEKGDTVITLESDKSSVEVPSNLSGTVKVVHIKIGDKVSEGSLVASLEGTIESNKINPPSSESKKNIEDKLNPEFEGRFKIMLVPNITNISYGRGVGYKIEEVVLPEEIQKISATKIRAKMREDGKLK